MSGLRVLTTRELNEIPEPSHLLAPFIVDGGLSVLFGPSGTYKSFVALDWALRVASEASSVYIAGEGSASLRRRVAAWQLHGAGRDIRAAWIPTPVNLLAKVEVDQLLTAIGALEWRPALVVIDTMARAMPGGDENSAQDVGRLVGSIDRLRAEFGCAALLIHHTGKQDSENERGSSALRGAADISIRAKPAGPLQVRLECAKVRDADQFDPVVVRLEPVEGSLVAASAVSPADALDRAVREYLADHPEASQSEVEREVRGKTDAIRDAYKRARPPRPEAGRGAQTTPPRAVPLKGAGRSLDPTLDPDEHARMRLMDGGW